MGDFEASKLAKLQSEHSASVLNLLQLPPPLVKPAVHPELNISLPPSVHDPNPTILQDLERCSEVMGVSEELLLSKREDLVEVSRRAQLFLDGIQPLLPAKFLREHKNPCWMAKKPNVKLYWNVMLGTFFSQNSKGLRLGRNRNISQFIGKPLVGGSREADLICLPHFFLAGFPKSATTTVHEALRKLPQVVEPAVKEPHWWTRVLGLSKVQNFDVEQLQLAFTAYTRVFEKMNRPLEASMDMITYDGSQSTLWDSNFHHVRSGLDYCAMPAVVSRVLPDAKFIVVLRNPVTRLYSHFLFSCQFHYGSIDKWPLVAQEQGNDLFRSQVEKDVEEFNQCTETLSDFECASIRSSSKDTTETINSSEVHCGLLWHRLTIGLYIVHIKKWLQFYPLENFLFIKMEDISEEPVETLSKITQFLNIAPVRRETARDYFSHPHNVLHNKPPPMDETTRVRLERFYQPYNEELAKTLNDERFLWTS